MEQYIARNKDEYPLSLLGDLRKEAVYGCSDPRLHPRVREQVDRLTEETDKRLEDDFQTLSSVLTDYAEQHGVLPYCVVLQCLASRCLGAGMVHHTFLDKSNPYRSSPQFSMMSCNLGNWHRSRFNQCQLPKSYRSLHLILIMRRVVTTRRSGTNLSSTIISSTLSRILEHIYELRGTKPLSLQVLA